MRRIRTLLIVLVAVGLYAWIVLRPSNDTVVVGQPVPTFALINRAGETVRLEDFRGRVVLINFWATWCPTCLVEMPSFNRLAEHFAGRPLQIIGISEDGESGGGWRAVDTYVHQHPLNFVILLDPDGHVADQFGTQAIPETFLIDQQGRLVRNFFGAYEWDDPAIIKQIEMLLSSPSGS